ncbi:MAG: Rrf2 family transcriptional regulator [Pseudomonadota bacterium]
MSTRGRYGARVMLELALRYEEGAIPLKHVAEKQEISPKYLVQIITSLKATGLVTSIRGSGGGYALARPPSQITLNEVIRAMEGSTALVNCVDDPLNCHRADSCAMRDVWVQIHNAMDNILGSLSLEMLAKRQKKKERSVTTL